MGCSVFVVVTEVAALLYLQLSSMLSDPSFASVTLKTVTVTSVAFLLTKQQWMTVEVCLQGAPQFISLSCCCLTTCSSCLVLAWVGSSWEEQMYWSIPMAFVKEQWIWGFTIYLQAPRFSLCRSSRLFYWQSRYRYFSGLCGLAFSRISVLNLVRPVVQLKGKSQTLKTSLL